MTNKIKERIKYFKHYIVDNLSLDAQDDFQKILDYITNLQEENERVSNLYQTYEEANGLWIKKYEDYKSRNEKAIEYIHNHQPVFELSSKGQIQKWFEKEYYVELLNILNGGDDNE